MHAYVALRTPIAALRTPIVAFRTPIVASRTPSSMLHRARLFKLLLHARLSVLTTGNPFLPTSFNGGV
jgi:hypothetical protein